MNYDKIKQQLIKHEDLRLFPYLDSVGKLTIGVGRNLDDNGISESEALLMLYNDIGGAERDARALVTTYHVLSDVRRRVLVNMAFNVGRNRLGGFKKMIAALELLDYQTAAKEMLDSKWARQVGDRASTLANMMETGLDQ